MKNADDRLIVALDVPNALDGLNLASKLGDAVSFYKVGLGMLTGGGMALASELKDEHGKRIFMDLKLFDIGATIEAAVRGLSQYNLDHCRLRDKKRTWYADASLLASAQTRPANPSYWPDSTVHQ